MKKIFILLLSLIGLQSIMAQKTKPVSKPKQGSAMRPVTIKDSKVKDSIAQILSSGKWQMSYITMDGEKKSFEGKVDPSKLPSMVFAKDGTFYGYNSGDDVVGKWTLSSDGKILTTIEKKNTDSFIIMKLSATELELKVKEADQIFGCKLIKAE
jgi:Lipocalin-like domain